ncbi:hypothetical protein GCM10011581_35070 [Saccharopolyspora subtropica]|uniref:Antitoxin n=1 Tax=Saccharopolyspora thermophila TaxID=89367 RepID=A0A917K1J8_9PSEU|nr:hypothetical protein GCM10011581_35070 [Saccharopolyspora subtropica]
MTVSDLIHRSGEVFDRLQHERRLIITRNGKLAGVLTAPDPDEMLLDEWADRGELPSDWRTRQRRLRSWLRHAPARSAPTGEPVGSAAILADREETDR